jgi:spore maturation protein CgeB
MIVGNPNPIHVGAHVLQAAADLGLEASLCDTNRAFAAPWIALKWHWHMRRRRPPRLRAFSAAVVRACRRFQPDLLLVTGIAPLDASALAAIGSLGIVRVNFLTDDPWNPVHDAPWFMQILPLYDYVFSPRRANLADLEAAGCRAVAYLPFAYNPRIHFVDPPATAAEQRRFSCDVMFAGGADPDRLPWMAALIRQQFQPALYGGYWERYPLTRRYARGHADGATLRKAVAGAGTVLCLVRRANRDGHVMRSFEVPAMGGCMLAEDSAEHRAIFGAAGEAVVYFRSTDEMIDQLRWLLAHPMERRQLAHNAHRRIIDGEHSYADRLGYVLRRLDLLPRQAVAMQ